MYIYSWLWKCPQSLMLHTTAHNAKNVESYITMWNQKSAHSLKSTTFAHFSYQIFGRVPSDDLHTFYNDFCFTCFCCFFFNFSAFVLFLTFLHCWCILSPVHIILQERADSNNTWRSQIVHRSTTTGGRNFCVNSFLNLFFAHF